MFFAVAESKLTAPSTFLTTWVVLFVDNELSSDLLATRLVTVLVAKSFDALTLCADEEVSEEEMFVALELLEDSATCEPVVTDAFSAACWALDDDASVAKLSEAAALADKLLLEERFKLAFKDAAPLPEFVVVSEALWVELLADPPLAAVVVLPAVPTFEEVAPPLVPLLLDVELPVEEPLEGSKVLLSGLLVAAFAVEPEADVSLLAWALVAEAPNVAAAVLALVFVSDPLAAKAFVVPLDLLEFEPSEAASDAVKLLLALACCALSLVWLKLFDEVLLLELSSVNEALSVVEWFNELLMLEEEVLLFVTFELLSTVSWLFCPRW
jgi:hypothetical protein